MSAKDGREIERVWVLRAPPVIPPEVPVETWRIEQGYLAPVAEGEAELARIGFPEGRLRRIVEPEHAQGRAGAAADEEEER